ncbi:MAG: thermonuclease family protein, partial [Rhodobacteraceae bacterium]|nr:thermonuclease family protein [Paracoccaceae bacterium]
QLQIVDGDTLILDGTRYRINGIDAPEAGQKCTSDRGKSWACGDAATNALYEMTVGRTATCKKLATDICNRIVARCAADGNDLAQEMVARGLAWAFLKFSDEYETVQDEAKQARLGIWQGEAQPAWEFRAHKWNKAEQLAPDGCPIKGNISKNGKIYHAPWSPWYKRTKINLSKGERWFCNEAEAVAAGWRAPYWH